MGADVRSEPNNDPPCEWISIDSAEFSVPVNSGDDLKLNYALKSKLNLASVRASGYLQNTWRWDMGVDKWVSLTAGACPAAGPTVRRPW
ncbi:MAG: hypothetical protein IPO87_19205 [Flavobacteriales bacterium]|nr:hypothetical protein [Flavobacteriales bacterium]